MRTNQSATSKMHLIMDTSIWTRSLLWFLSTALALSTHIPAHSSLAPALEARTAPNPPLPVQLVHDFPDGTWIENLAVRANGQIIATEDTKPRIYLVDPSSLEPAILLHDFNNTASILGIVETSPDIFHLCSGNFSSAALKGYGEAYIFRFDMRNFSATVPGSAKISMVAKLTQAGALNGLTYLESSGLLLVSDSLNDLIWSIDINTGENAAPINNTFTRSTGIAINGLKVFDNHLYFTNTGKQTLVRIPINGKGEAIGNFTVLSQGIFAPDDFAIDIHGNCYVTSHTQGKNGVWLVLADGGPAEFIAEMAGPTAAAFGRTQRDRSILYVSASGGDDDYGPGKNVTVSGKILGADVGRLWRLS